MNLRLTALMVALIGASLSIAACNRNDTASQRTAARTADSTSVSSSQSATPATPPASSSDTSSSSTSPSAASTQPQASAQDTHDGETAKASDPPMSSMTKEEETKAMPQPGQTNDYNTLAQDPKQPK
jgi:hypothetical protein